MELEDEATWLRQRAVRMRVALRFAGNPEAEVILRELIGDIEDRLMTLEGNGAKILAPKAFTPENPSAS